MKNNLSNLLGIIKDRMGNHPALFYGVFFLSIVFLAVLLMTINPQKIILKKSSNVTATKHLLVDKTPQPAQPDALSPCLGNGLYNIHDDKVYYQFINRSCHPVEGGYDTATFEVLDYGFARDKNKGFYKGQAIKTRGTGTIYPQVKTDGITFEALAEGYAHDKDNVYFFNGSNFYKSIIDGADPATFKVLSTWFGKDAYSGYYGWSAILQSDGSTFEVVDTKPTSQYEVTGFTKDAAHVFLNDKMINGADPKTFQVYKNLSDVSGRLFSRDSAHVFWGTSMIPEADPDSFQLVESSTLGMCAPYFKDKSHVFVGTEIIAGVDPNSFRYIGQVVRTPVLYNEPCLAADKNNVYINNTKIPNLDPQSIQDLGIYLKDKDAVYLYTTELKGTDSKTFELLNADSVSAKDKNSVYECGRVIMPNQTGFQLLGDYYGKIGSNVYYLGQIIPGADAISFTSLGEAGIWSCESPSGGYAKDKSHVYFAGKLIQGADPQTFKLGFELGTAHDKNGEFRFGVRVPNDFVKCSTDTTDLPGGLSIWQSKLPLLDNDTTMASFEFCLMPNQEMLIGYKPDPQVEAKTVSWLDAKNQLIETMTLDCGNFGAVLPQSIGVLNGSIVTLMCLAHDACTSRVFYELNLDNWRSSGSSTLQKTDESYDCGYRG